MMHDGGSIPVAAWGVVDEYAYGPAAQFLAKLANFAGNATRDYDIGGSYVERVTSVAFLLAAVGGATNRIAVVSFLDEGGAVIGASAAPFAVTAGNTSQITFSVGAQQGGALNAPAIVASLPSLYLQPTYTARLSVNGGAAADTVSLVRVLTSRFSTAPQVFPPGQGPE
jgi:hypothetical protein